MASNKKAETLVDKAVVEVAKLEVKNKPSKRTRLPRFLVAIGNYFKGAWYEIRQVRWPSRASTWKSTVAVLLFTAFWTAVVLAFDLLFQTVINTVLS